VTQIFQATGCAFVLGVLGGNAEEAGADAPSAVAPENLHKLNKRPVRLLTKSGNATLAKSFSKSFDGDFSLFDHTTPQIDLLFNECPGLFGGTFLQFAAQLCHASFDLRRI
jgi:hypothetical protein